MDRNSPQRSNAIPIDPDEILKGIVEWIEIESPSHDAQAVNRMVDRAEADMRGLGARIERVPGSDGKGDVLHLETEKGGKDLSQKADPKEVSSRGGKGRQVVKKATLVVMPKPVTFTSVL